MDVWPSAPSYNDAQPLYPTHELTELNAEDLRLKKISDLLKELSDEAKHYRHVAKKYNRSRSIVHTSAVGLGSLSVGLSSGALATALTGFGIVASPALAGVATVCGIASVCLDVVSDRLERKVTKHEKIYTLAIAKRNSIIGLVSKALEDKRISDAEFRIISREVEKYHELKAAIRAGVRKATNDVAKQTQAPDPEKLKKSFAKKSNLSFKKGKSYHRSVQVRFERLNSGFNLYVSKVKSHDAPN